MKCLPECAFETVTVGQDKDSSAMALAVDKVSSVAIATERQLLSLPMPLVCEVGALVSKAAVLAIVAALASAVKGRRGRGVRWLGRGGVGRSSEEVQQSHRLPSTNMPTKRHPLV